MKRKYYAIYTLLFMGICLNVYAAFYLNNKTFINWVNDGFAQHYKALIYYSEYLRELLRNVFVEHSFTVPQWDFSIGEGSDIITTLHTYAIGDPIAFFSVLVPREYIYVYYDFSIVLRLYISGIAFSELCFYTKKTDIINVLTGTLMYVFCFWALFHSNEHIYFLNPMIYMPLLVLGVEKIINKDKPYIFVLSVLFGALSNFYFFYMMVVLTVIYVAVRLLTIYGLNFKEIGKNIIRLFVFAIMGVMMSAIILLPVVYAFVSDSRIGADISYINLYSRFYYERLFSIFVSNDNQYDLCMGFAAPALFGIALSIRKIKKNPLFFLLDVVALILVCVPLCGRLMNGMSYPINRWSFALSLLFAYQTTSEIDDFKDNKLYLLICTVGFFAAAFVSPWSRNIRVYVPMSIYMAYIAVLYIKINANALGMNAKRVLMLLLTIINIIFVANYDYSDFGIGRSKQGLGIKETIDETFNSDSEVLKQYLKEEDNYFYRFSANTIQTNSSMIADMKSTDFYWSLTNPNIISYRTKLAINDFASYRYNGYNDRASLYSLANVKYFFTTSKEETVPYGFVYDGSIENMDIYRNEYFLPFGYTYDETISYDEWNKLDPVTKQEVLAKRIVIESGDDSSFASKKKEANFKLVGNDLIEVLEKGFEVKEPNTELTISVEGYDNCENSLTFNNLNFDDTEGYVEENRTAVPIDVYLDGKYQNVFFCTSDYQFYTGRHDFSACFGYKEDAAKEIRIVFPYPGVYTYDSITFDCLSYEEYEQDIESLCNDTLSDVLFSDNHISGNINLEEDKYLLLSVPYSKGWKAYADGKQAELLKANECYMAIKLEKGTHNIELKYETPFLKIGACISALSMVAFVAYCILDRKGKINI